MKITIQEINQVKIAVVNSDSVLIRDGQSALDFVMTVKDKAGCDRIMVNKKAIADEFFILSNGIAGEVLQKFINYHFKIAIVGDFSCYTSKPLRDFIYESNQGKDVFFVAAEEDAAEKLSHT